MGGDLLNLFSVECNRRKNLVKCVILGDKMHVHVVSSIEYPLFILLGITDGMKSSDEYTKSARVKLSAHDYEEDLVRVPIFDMQSLSGFGTFRVQV